MIDELDMMWVDICIKTIFAKAAKMKIETHDECVALIESVANEIRSNHEFTPEEMEKIRRTVEYQISVKLKPSTMLVSEEHVPWYGNRMAEIDSVYEGRYKDFIRDKIPLKSLADMDRTTNRIMDCMGDPKLHGTFNRKGLVVGDIQSGKTNSYIHLICKAIDAGYDVVIVLAGMSESLRMQTQYRIDEGVIGWTIDEDGSRMTIGVGEIDGNPKPWNVTTVYSDFANPFRGIGMPMSDPVILVVKKNAVVLKNVLKWLDNSQNTNGNSVIDKSLLLIDDEADNASINTGGPKDPDNSNGEYDVTSINKSIRGILSMFARTSYVGYTATPYANIFVDPESFDKEVLEDLFPKDFIINIWPPSNYIGAMSMFYEGGKDHFMVRTIPNSEKVLDGASSKKGARLIEVPESLRKAISCYVVGSAMRDLNGQSDEPMSMMIHISRYIDVQQSIVDTIDEFVNKIKSDIELNYARDPDRALANPTMRMLHDVWEEEYSDMSKYARQEWQHNDWVSIQRRLNDSAHLIKIKVVNSSNDKNVDYVKEPGLRAIVIGGDALSRGLTLNGLMVSYFYRKSKQYDSLLQMGRWFGYRDEYSDICRVWISQTQQNWYGYVGQVNKEMKERIDQMSLMHRTPKDYGMLVEEDIPGFIITARNKMRTSTSTVVLKTISGEVFDTARVFVDHEIVRKNNYLLDGLYGRLDRIKPYVRDDMGNVCWSGVPKEEILTLLADFEIDPGDAWYGKPEFTEFIKALGMPWDVAVVNRRDSDPIILGNKAQINRVGRSSFAYNPDKGKIVEVANRSLMSPDDPRAFLSKETVESLRKEKGAGLNAKDYMIEGRNPLLMIYYLHLSVQKSGPNAPVGEDLENVKRLTEGLDSNNLSPVGLMLGFPRNAEGEPPKKIKYRTNKVYERIRKEGSYNEREHPSLVTGRAGRHVCRRYLGLLHDHFR